VIWNDEADSLLVQLWDEGGSLSHVAEGMQKAGYDVSRSAVSGRRHRLPGEMFRRKGTTTATSVTPYKREPKQKKDSTVKITTRRPATTAELEENARNEGVEYLEQTSFGCKAILPVRSGPWKLQKVCGKQRGTDYHGCMSPYCPTHFRMFTNPYAGVGRKQHV